MLLVLLLLCVIFSALTLKEQQPEGASAGRLVAEDYLTGKGNGVERVLIVGQSTKVDHQFVTAAKDVLANTENLSLEALEGEPRDIRRRIAELNSTERPVNAILTTNVVENWPLMTDLHADFPALGDPAIRSAKPYTWPTFLKADNLLNVSNQITEIAIVAVGMTIVIITAGIDLSVGSLIALSAMTSCLLIQEYGGGREATPLAMTASSFAGIGVCGVIGLLTGVLVTLFRVPPFVVTLGVMLSASGLAGLLTGGEAAYLVPDSYTQFASGRLFGIPHAVWLMLLLYIAGHLLMSKTLLGRHIYAVGGNRMAAHLSGIRTHRVLLFAYTLSALTAGLAGVVMASRLKSGNPTFGKTYELYVIAAVVVGGTSLSGGSGKMFGTLIGAFIIAVIQNGMNLLNVGSFTQDVVLGLVLLSAVVIDQIKRGGLKSWLKYP